MRALQQTSLNGPADLHLADLPTPVPGPGEVLLRVTAAGVNYVDLSQTRGTFAGGPRPPYVAGIEAAGEVVALGPGVTTIAVGTHVAGLTVGGGAFAEYVTLPAAAVVEVPAGWSDEQSLGLLVNWPTAVAALTTLGGLSAGQTVLIHAAAGGTGQAAVTLARHLGARVLAVASPAKHDVVRGLGADHVLDPAFPAAEILDLTDGNGADLVLDSVGGPAFEESLAATRRVTGRLVVYGTAGGPATLTNWDLVYRHPIHVIGLNLGALLRHGPQLFGEVFALLAAGVIRPTRPTTYSLADGPKALTELEARATIGKLALIP